MTFSVIVLAAGRGKRMRTTSPKVLQLLAGKPLLHHILHTTLKLSPQQTIVVCGYEGIQVQTSCANFAVEWVWQKIQKGTGNAVNIALSALQMVDRVLIVNGDVPLITVETLQNLFNITPLDGIGFVTIDQPFPNGLGRIIRNSKGKVIEIIEERDANSEQLAIQEVNAGIYIMPKSFLLEKIVHLTSNNEAQEFYITDLIKIAVACGIPIHTYKCENNWEVLGVNTQHELAQLERIYQRKQADKLLANGVKLYDPNRIDIRGNVNCGSNVCFDINVILEGDVTIGNGVTIGPNVLIKNSTIGDNVIIYANSIIDNSIINSNCEIGPFARIRPNNIINSFSKIGNFVEIKNSNIGSYTKINHLSYVGDACIGDKVNIGAGTITCNFDGFNKNKTIIENDVFVGSNCELIAPIHIGQGATIAAGTTLNKAAPANTLTLTKKQLKNIAEWTRPGKKTDKKTVVDSNTDSNADSNISK